MKKTSQTNHLAARIKAMKIGHPILLATPLERQRVLNITRTLRQAGVINFHVVTRPYLAGGFTATAVPE